jgi:formate dehydrogenase subunit gamma
MMLRSALILLLTTLFCGMATAQDSPAATIDRSATGGAQTLSDIMARQNARKLDDTFRRDAIGAPGGGASEVEPLGTRGGQSDSEVWRAIRYNDGDATASNSGFAADVLIQSSGMAWLKFREGPLAFYGAWLLGGTLLLLALFFLLRGRIRLEGEWSGRKILRFTSVERFGHWLLAGSFILLAITGLISLFGRMALIPLIGKEWFAAIAAPSKVIHNSVAWAFMLGLAMLILLWTVQNIPNRHDLVWLAKGGGMFSKGVHPPARKFNAGQKLMFWGVVVFGLSITVSGLSLLFPFELPLFAKTFAVANHTGIPQAVGLGILPETMPPHQEMQLAQIWHSIIAFFFIAMIFAHIYIGTLGMEGAFEAMGDGEVDEQWAREHHGLWLDEVKERDERDGAVTPAE